jgi:tetratricopeptide (TPR) repeat protein
MLAYAISVAPAASQGSLITSQRYQGKGDIALDMAIADFSRIIRDNPASAAVAYVARAALWLKRGNTDIALVDYDRALAINPRSADGHVGRASIMSLNKDYWTALYEYNLAIEIDPKNVDAHVGRGTVLDEQGALDQAISEYNLAIEIDPRNVGAYAARGVTWGKLKNYPKAEADLSKAALILKANGR